MVKKKRDLEKKNSKLLVMVETERQKSEGLEQVFKIQNTYIAILLKKLGATSEGTAITITNEEIKRTMDRCEIKGAIPEKGVWKLYCEEDETE